MLAELRQAGEPVDAADLAKRFPDPAPHADAERLYARALAFATNHPIPGNTPIIMSPVSAKQHLDEPSRRALDTFFNETREIESLLPTSVPKGTRFLMRWDLGFSPTNQLFRFIRARALSQVLTTRAIAATEAGRKAEAASMLTQGFVFAGGINRDARYVEHMIGHACNDLLRQAAEYAMNRLEFEGAELQAIRQSIVREGEEDFENAARVERCQMLWAFSVAHRGGKERDIIGSEAKPYWTDMWERLKSGRPFYRKEDYVLYLESIPGQINALKLPYPATAERISTLARNYDATAVSEVGAWGSLSLSERVWRRHAEAAACLETLLGALAVEQFRAESNQIPRTLQELVPRYLPEVPTDPFISQPVKLKLLPRGYMVYSVGADLVDHGGRAKTNGLQAAYDLPFTVER